ncbi:LysR family transcriptional regulator [Actinoplanes subtropicus]|uniref:LysR family transcriptional regulator n=1 Tax=Actinoplanes subtropicus TaxID=543632 RepID=UPI001FE05C3C|nr:LysR family transcriptional regulator [Actinoplanes subtropicus]
MRSFVTVADKGSFAGAAKSLGTSGSLVSRHIADLERQVGARLLNRSARSISLTESGVAYRDFARRILQEIEQQDQDIAQMQDRPEGMLSIICPKWIGSLDIGDAIAAFAVAHPKITVRFELSATPTSERTYDFLDSGFDVAFHTRDLRDSAVRLRRIAGLPFVVCASPGYLAQHGDLQYPNDLADHDCLVHVNDSVWRIGLGPSSTLHKIRRVAFVSNSYITLQKVAVHGRGIALLPQRAVYDNLAEGSLVRLLPDIPVPERSLYAVFGPGGRVPRKVQVVLDFLSIWFKKNPISQPGA